MAVYIASDSPLPVVQWNKDAAGFHVAELTTDENDEKVRVQFSKPYVYYVGAHTGCGCGFEYGKYPEYEDDVEESRESVLRLAEYLTNAVKENASVELFACWEGDQAEKPVKYDTIAPFDIGGDSFWFEEKQFLLIQQKR